MYSSEKESQFIRDQKVKANLESSSRPSAEAELDG
jgi:hypothetical protein